MTRRVIAALAGALALVAGLLLLTEHRSVSPGALARAHADLADLNDNCRACHTPFVGAASGCRSCHGVLPPVNKHAETRLACTACHQEHRGTQVRLVAHAGADCTACHAHPSISAVQRHRAQLIERPLESAPHVLNYSHRFHFNDIQESIDEGQLTGDAYDCARCHLTGAAGGGRSEHTLVFSGCTPCHKNWAKAGLKDVAPETTEVPFTQFISPARLSRIRFRHSPGHLRTPCRECHAGIQDAKSLRLPDDYVTGAPLPDGVAAAKSVRNCFGCHAHSPDAKGAPANQAMFGAPRPAWAETTERAVVACVECHEFHGVGSHGDFPEGSNDEPRPRPWDVWARVAGFSVTPWLLALLGGGALGYVALLRRFPATERAPEGADPGSGPQRLVEVPALSPSYESSIPGVYIVGELAGVPLINRAMKSGFDAIDFIANKLQIEGRAQGDGLVDVVIAGAGPAGLGAATRAKSLGLSYVFCEKGGAAATIRSYPRAKVVQTAPIDIPEYGTFFQEDDESKEGLVRRWEDIIARTQLVIEERAEVVGVERAADATLVTTVVGDKRYRSRFVVLAIGVRGTPRHMGVPGETPERVAYNLIDADEFHQRRILVVGGGNAACEAAVALSAPALDNDVTLSHRGAVLRDVTPENSRAIDTAVREGQLQVEPDSSFKEIRATTVLLGTPGGPKEIPNDFIFAMIGAELPTKFLRAIGVKLVKKGGL